MDYHYRPYWESQKNGEFIYEKKAPIKARAFSFGVGLWHVTISPLAVFSFAVNILYSAIKVVSCSTAYFATCGQLSSMVQHIKSGAISLWNGLVGLSTYPITAIAMLCGIIHPAIPEYTVKLFNAVTIKI